MKKKTDSIYLLILFKEALKKLKQTREIEINEWSGMEEGEGEDLQREEGMRWSRGDVGWVRRGGEGLRGEGEQREKRLLL